MTELEKAHARIEELETQEVELCTLYGIVQAENGKLRADLEAIGAGGVSGPLMRTPTSGAADLPDALINIAREIEALKRDCSTDPESAIAIQNGRYMAISYKVRALAAGQATAAPAQPAAQQGVAYAALPDEGEPWHGHKFKEVRRGCWRCDCGKTIKEVTSDQSTPASGGNYPVMPKRYTVDDDGEELFTAEKMRAFADATHTLRASHGQAPAGATLYQIMAAAKELHAINHPTGEPEWGALRQCEIDALRRRAERILKAAAPTAPSTPSSTAQQASAHVLHLVQAAFAEVAMAYPKAFALHKVGLADTAVRKALAAYTPQTADSVQEDAARESEYRRGYRHGYEQRDAEVRGAMA